MDAVRKRIARAIKERGLDYKKVSTELGMNHAYIQQFIERRVPQKLNEDLRSRLSELLDIPEEELGAPVRSRPASPADPPDQIAEIDVLAGLGGGGLTIVEQTSQNGVTFHKEAVRDYWRLPSSLLHRFNAAAHHIAAFPAGGDSMSPTIQDGDVVFADTRHRVPSPPGVYVLADEFGGVVIKRLEVVSRRGDDPIIVRVSSDNPHHPPKELTLEEIAIIGRYIGRFTV